MSDFIPLSDAIPISIWQPQIRDGGLYFVRLQPTALGDHYAKRLVIPAHKAAGVRRICFFGESVAAGYLYAPHVTPAKLLQQQLSIIDQTLEVIDLARTNETLSSLLDTVAASRQLQPDVWVIFVGNNWNLLETPQASPYYPSIATRQAVGVVLEHGGMAQLVAETRRQRLGQAAATLQQIAEWAQSTDIRVVLVIPAVNLADWESRQPVQWLPEQQVGRWYALLAQTHADLDNRRWDAALQSAELMQKLDGGNCPTTHRLIATAQQGRADFSAAREA